MVDQEVKNRVIEKMLRKRVVGGKNMTIQAIVDMALPSHEQGDGKTAIEEFVADPTGPIERYGGQRNAVRLTSVEDAVEYLRAHDGNVPFGF